MSRYGGGDTTRVVYRDARDVEGGSTVSRSAAAPRSNNESYTTRKVYRVSNQDEEEERIPAFLAPRERTYGETRVVRRERTPEPEPIVERREIRIRERTPEPEPEPVVERREIRIEREREPQPEPRRYETEYRYDREIDRVAPRRDDLERYVRTVDYYPRQEAPQPIIIRQEPQQIIIQEAPRPPVVVSPPPLPTTQEESYDIIKRSEVRSEVGHRSESHRSEVGEERQIARRPKPPKPEPEEEEEDYYYERRTRRIDGRDRDDEEYESSHRRRDRERDVSPGDSISQYGRDRRGGYDSDSSYEYIKRETREEFSDEEPRHRRHLAEGAAVGLGAAELLRHHRKKKGEDEGGRGSRVGRDVGAAALGAIGAEAVTRARSHYRSKSRRGSRDRGSRDRDRDGDREGRRKHKRDKSRGKERSRSESNHRVRNLAGLGLGAAAVAAAVGYANRNAKKSEGQDRRSRSRTRRDSVGALPAPEEADDARNASHRNKKIAQAGLAGAAVAGLVERARSKSRGGGKRDRSKSRIRQGLPIAATALGSAAVAGLYEKQQAGKKEKEARREERAARRSARSRSRSHGYDASREAPVGDPGLIEYGQEPVYNQNGVPDFYNRPASQTGYYNNTEDAMVPAATAGAAYGAQAQRDMDRGQRQRSISSGSDDGRRRRRHRRHKSGSRTPSRSRDATTAALAAGAAGLAASEHEKRKQRKREKKEERRRQEAAERASYSQDPYGQQYQPNSPPPAGYQNEGQQTPYYPPPPGQEYPGATPAPVGQIQHEYNYPQQPGYTPPVPNTYSPTPGAAGYAPQPREPRRADENVSAEMFHNTANNDVPLNPNNDALSLLSNDAPFYDSNGAPFYYEPNNFSGEGVNTPRAQSPSRPSLQRRASSQPPPTTKTVQFALDTPPSSRPSSPKQIRQRRQHASSSKHSQHDDYDSEDGSSSRKDKSRARRRRHRRSSSDDPSRSSSPAESDSTVELPERFDERGRPLAQQDDDPVAHIEELFGGRGSVGRLLQNFGLGGGSDDGDRNRDRDRRGRRRR